MPDLKRQDGRQAREVECDLGVQGNSIDLNYMSNIWTRSATKLVKSKYRNLRGITPGAQGWIV